MVELVSFEDMLDHLKNQETHYLLGDEKKQKNQFVSRHTLTDTYHGATYFVSGFPVAL